MTGCRKQPVVRAAVQLLFVQVRKLIEGGSTRSVDQLVASLTDSQIATTVAYAGKLEARKQRRRRRNRAVRRQTHRDNAAYRGQRGAAIIL